MRLQLKRAASASVVVASLFARSLAFGDDVQAHVSSEAAAYGDTDHVFVVTPGVAGMVEKPSAGWSVSGSYLVDVVSAASVDIVSTASRRWEEVRQAGTLGGAYKIGDLTIGADAAVSFEPDYTSITGGLLLSQDLLNKNLTLTAGYDHGHDVAGRSGTPFSVFSHDIDTDGFKAGVTGVLDNATIASALVDAMFENGDSSKPYRYIPMFAPGTSVPVGASIDQVMQLRLPERVLEQLPLSRNRYALTVRLAHRFARSTLRLEERGYIDTWGLQASTSDARFIADFGRRWSLGPHVRFHAQTPVNFWQREYIVQPGFDYPALRTGDRELGPLMSLTGGGSLRWAIGPDTAPKNWILGLDANVTSTRYIDDLYVTSRLSVLGALRLEAEF